jgi:hypothetical protein
MGRLMKKPEGKTRTLQSLLRKYQHLISQQGDFVKFPLLTELQILKYFVKIW